MALAELLARLESEAQTEAARIASDAAARAREIADAGSARLERERRAATERLHRTREDAVRRGLAAAERSARERRLTARAAAVDRILAAARGTLQSVPAERYAALIPELVADTVRYLEGRAAVLTCPADAAPRVAALAAGATVESPPGALPGILGRTADGRVTVDNTLAARLDRRQADLAIALAARLEGGADALG
ncbi:MAG: V-type ATP synthase subunit E [Gemmatimonadales bacterium]